MLLFPEANENIFISLRKKYEKTIPSLVTKGEVTTVFTDTINFSKEVSGALNCGFATSIL